MESGLAHTGWCARVKRTGRRSVKWGGTSEVLSAEREAQGNLESSRYSLLTTCGGGREFEGAAAASSLPSMVQGSAKLGQRLSINMLQLLALGTDAGLTLEDADP